MAASVCRSCSMPIAWGESAGGKRIPLNPDGSSHFTTCPDAKTWSKPATTSAAQPALPTQDHRAIALQAASAFCAGRCLGGNDVSSREVLQIAAHFEKWLKEGSETV